MASSYIDDGSSTETSHPLFVCEVIIAIIFALDYIYNFMKAKKKTQFFWKPRNLFDLLTIMPFMLSMIPVKISNTIKSKFRGKIIKF